MQWQSTVPAPPCTRLAAHLGVDLEPHECVGWTTDAQVEREVIMQAFRLPVGCQPGAGAKNEVQA